MVKIIFHSPTVVAVNDEFISAPPPFPLGDCRGCALIGLVCEDSYDYPCRGAIYFYEKETGKNVSYEDFDEDEELFDKVMEYKPCCWECPFLMECLEDFHEIGGEEYIESMYGISWDKFKDIVLRIQRNVMNK
jgi:hypothetical protein